MVRKPVVTQESLDAVKAFSAARAANMKQLIENETPAQRKHRENYNKFMGVPDHEMF